MPVTTQRPPEPPKLESWAGLSLEISLLAPGGPREAPWGPQGVRNPEIMRLYDPLVAAPMERSKFVTGLSARS